MPADVHGDRRSGRALRNGSGAENLPLLRVQRVARGCLDDPGPHPGAVRHRIPVLVAAACRPEHRPLSDLLDHAVRDVRLAHGRDLRWVRRGDVEARGHDDVHSRPARQPRECERVAPDSGRGHVDDRRASGRLVEADLEGGDLLVVEDEVGTVAEVVRADPAEVLERERRERTAAIARLGRRVEHAREVDEEMLVRHHDPERGGLDRAEHRVRAAPVPHRQRSLRGGGAYSRELPARLTTTASVARGHRPSGAEGARTPDLLAASQTLSQLSYGPGTMDCRCSRQASSRNRLSRWRRPRASARRSRRSSRR